MEKLEKFISTILEARKVWLLEAKEGFFAMLEDNDGEPYMPLWESEAAAARAAQGDWEGYTTTDMGFSELHSWLRELAADDIDIAIAPEADGEITAIPAQKFRSWLKPYDDHSFKDEEEEPGCEIDTKYGPDDKSFDYGDGWAQPWS